MYIIIAGGGIIGTHIASLLTEEDHEVLVIDQSSEILDKIRNRLDVKTILGNSATPKTLKQAEAERADLVLAVTNNDETNMITCFMSKELGATTTAARIRNPDFSYYFIAGGKSPLSPRRIIRPKKLGVDVFINPEMTAAHEIVAILSSLYSTPTENFAGGLVQIREFGVEDEGLIGLNLSQLIARLPHPAVIAALVRQGELLIPTGQTVIQKEDSIYLAAGKDYIDEVGKILSTPHRPAKRIVILGGDRIGHLAAEGLSRRGAKVKLIEPDIPRAEELASKLNNVEIINGSGTNRDFLIELGVPSADAYVSTTNNDELNILSALLAKKLGVPRSMVIINNATYVPLAEAIGIDVAALPTLLAADEITRFVLHGGAIATAFLEGDKMEAVEFMASPTASITNHRINEVGLPAEAVAIAVLKGNDVLLPPGETLVEPGDHVIITAPISSIRAVEKLFK
ncbi:MAG: Trk system potassium transporter TrkA [Dehalococcoidales bacterium]|jgi:trk system potassium uptake protein TrkA|nr:Trk system potassium transporter TrkA [Dehalococcoidales bacterium]MDD5605096.1 Trk system potassium transporter TrkA [Dehalococcoidales bacterium]MDX9985881.1 Trk system potassium transporter TrkA [Dehalococcoidales bacterium]